MRGLRVPGIRGRITTWAVLVATVIAIGIYVALLALHRRTYQAEVRDELAREGRQLMWLAFTDRLNPVLTGSELAQVVDSRGVVLAATVPMSGRPQVNYPPPGPDYDRGDGRSCHVNAPGGGCFLIVVFRVGTGPSQRVIYTMTPEPGLIPDPSYALLSGFPVPIVVALTGIATWRGVGRALRPVEAVRAELDEITATDLERRVPVPEHHDEIGRLAESVNATLDRLEGAVARLRGFVSDVSHELRSPLTGLRMELELALTEPPDSDQRPNLRALLEAAGRLQDVLDDLLAMARLESGPELDSERVDLQELADQSVLARPRRARFAVEGGEPVVVRGGRSSLGRLLTNLLDNADRHAATSVTVTVQTEPGGGKGRAAVVEVFDDGPGIAPKDRERVFERFTRLAEGRHRDAGGTGLGLAISRDIATAHGGTLVLTDREDGRSGARFVLRLPAL